MSQAKAINSFYVALLPVGVLFALTACAYTVVTVRALQPGSPAEPPIGVLLNQHGLTLIILELLLLALLTFAAIATDNYWTKPLPLPSQQPSAEDRS